MKTITKMVLMAIAFAVATPAIAATISFVKREAAGTPGNFKYTYSYTCAKGKKGTLTVQSANDNSARQLAQLEANEKCGEN